MARKNTIKEMNNTIITLETDKCVFHLLCCRYRFKQAAQAGAVAAQAVHPECLGGRGAGDQAKHLEKRSKWPTLSTATPALNRSTSRSITLHRERERGRQARTHTHTAETRIYRHAHAHTHTHTTDRPKVLFLSYFARMCNFTDDFANFVHYTVHTLYF